MSGRLADDRQPVAMTHQRAVSASPRSVVMLPALRLVVVMRRDDARIEPDVLLQVESLDDVVRIAQDLRLRRIALAPLPFLRERIGELVGVLHALDVAARARIAIPVPRPADPAARLDCAAPRGRARAAGAACRGPRSRHPRPRHRCDERPCALPVGVGRLTESIGRMADPESRPLSGRGLSRGRGRGAPGSRRAEGNPTPARSGSRRRGDAGRSSSRGAPVRIRATHSAGVRIS